MTAEGGRPAQRDGGLSGYEEEEEEGPGRACVAREPPEQQKDQQDRHHPTRLQADSMGPPPHKVPFPRGLVWELHPGEGGEESGEGRRRRDGFSNTHTASFLGPPFPRPLLECSAPSLASVPPSRQASTQSSPPCLRGPHQSLTPACPFDNGLVHGLCASGREWGWGGSSVWSTPHPRLPVQRSQGAQ